jgi:hypothetical protein
LVLQKYKHKIKSPDIFLQYVYLTTGRNVSCSVSFKLLNGAFSQGAPYTILVLVVVFVLLLLCTSKIKIHVGTYMFISEISVQKYSELKHLSNFNYLRLREISVLHNYCVNTGHINVNCLTEMF